MSRPPLWLCQDCRRPLGQILDGDLDVFGPSRIEPGRTVVRCVCGASRIWYDGVDPEKGRSTEFARQP